MINEPLDLLARMQQQVTTWSAAGDRRAVFLDCYRLMTANMLAALERGDFADAGWVDHLLHRFADYYFDALVAYERDDPATPAIWRMAHQAAQQPHVLPLQHLMLGVNAHINYDLTFTVVELLQPEWETLDPERRRQRFADYSLVNQVIAQTIDTVQDEVITRLTPAFFMVDKLLGRVDEWATARLLTAWRDAVWANAVRLLTCPDPATHTAVCHTVETVALRRAEAILQPTNLAALRSLFSA